MKLVDEVCSKTSRPCRFCSHDVQVDTVHFSVVKDCMLGKKGDSGKKTRRIELAEMCNNVSRPVKDLDCCPAEIALATPLVPLKSSSVVAKSSIKKTVKKVVKKSAKKPKRKAVKKIVKPLKGGKR